MLIDHGADVNVHGLDGDTPLHDAAANGHEEITIVLIQSGNEFEKKNDFFFWKYFEVFFSL